VSDGIHVDRKKVMESKSVDFHESYEEAIKNITRPILSIDAELAEKLKAKRDFGYKKYAEKSYQGTFTNAMATPTLEDIEEELVDVINYLLHLKFKLLFTKPTLAEFANSSLAAVLDIYNDLQKAKQIESND